MKSNPVWITSARLASDWPRDNHVLVEFTAKGTDLSFNEGTAASAAVHEVVFRTCLPARKDHTLWFRESDRWKATMTFVKQVGKGRYVACFKMTSDRPPRTPNA